jgi:hypothetical protein
MIHNQSSAEESTGLASRHRPDATAEFLRCQLGVHVVEHRITPATRDCPSFNGPVTLFHTFGFGRTWDEAVAVAKSNMRRNRTK